MSFSNRFAFKVKGRDVDYSLLKSACFGQREYQVRRGLGKSCQLDWSRQLVNVGKRGRKLRRGGVQLLLFLDKLVCCYVRVSHPPLIFFGLLAFLVPIIISLYRKKRLTKRLNGNRKSTALSHL
jgi:hypothetical protein